MRKFLLVEDNPDLQVLLTRQIEWMGFTVILASNGIEGVEKPKIFPSWLLRFSVSYRIERAAWMPGVQITW